LSFLGCRLLKLVILLLHGLLALGSGEQRYLIRASGIEVMQGKLLEGVAIMALINHILLLHLH
jgi:hypothetical protein